MTVTCVSSSDMVACDKKVSFPILITVLVAAGNRLRAGRTECRPLPPKFPEHTLDKGARCAAEATPFLASAFASLELWGLSHAVLISCGCGHHQGMFSVLLDTIKRGGH